MRIVAVADTHLFHEELDVPPGDIFIHAGDLCRAGTLEELARAAAWLRSLPHPQKIVVAGNHDWALQRQPAEARRLLAGMTYLQDSEAQISGLRVYGSPWQPEYNRWAFNLPRGAPLAQKWARIPQGLDILITHGPPAGIGDGSSVGKLRAGCEALRARLAAARPRLHLFGHIHEDGGAWEVEGCTFVNCTSWECERPPTIIDLDPATGAIRVTAPPASGAKV